MPGSDEKTVQAALRALHNARALLVSRLPYYAHAAFALRFVPSDRVATLGVRRDWALEFSPRFVLQQSEAVLAGLLYHEILHPLRRHHERMVAALVGRGIVIDEHSLLLANIAADLEIADDIEEESFDLPRQAIRPSLFFSLPRGLILEEYLAQLLRGEPDRDSVHVLRIRFEDGSAQRVRLPFRVSLKRDLLDGDDIDAFPEHEREQIRKITASRILDSGGRGTIPKGARRWAAKILCPATLDPLLIVFSFFRYGMQLAHGRARRSFRRLSRRPAPGILRPGWVAPRPKTAVIIDTSGSMTDELLGIAVNEAQALVLRSLHSLGTREVHLIACDADVHTSQRVDVRRLGEFLRGGGGTDLRVAFDAAVKERCDNIVVFTDGETPWPELPPPANTLTVLLGFGASGPDWPERTGVFIHRQVAIQLGQKFR
ncbi:MAG: VWA-like domain-containing protein [Candidatus Binatia bacterium]|nr:VWA-like domain-containing protein [Candidatus Binatia bacterium]